MLMLTLCIYPLEPGALALSLSADTPPYKPLSCTPPGAWWRLPKAKKRHGTTFPKAAAKGEKTHEAGTEKSLSANVAQVPACAVHASWRWESSLPLKARSLMLY
ncbi:Uncharacterized protein TCM_005937 [Theobroma cacao]|uniref:Uncharacterized protein n=1 Tax=Theobroma cacao TaxID=3641 RepID=A0A061DXG5_THECC|nr:Uncharacterized protein TCM_005937 [Theobroma cacao]